MKKSYLIFGLIFVLILALFFYIGSFEEESQELEQPTDLEEVLEFNYMDVSAEEAKRLIDSNSEIIVIDVSPHYDRGHIPGAISYYPLSTLRDAVDELDKDAMYLIYCHADGPSRSGAEILIDAGFMNVYRLESHFGGWQEAGYEIEM